MKLKMLIVITLLASLALVAACSKSEDESSSLEKTTEQAAEAVSEAASDVKHAAGEAMDEAGEMADHAMDATDEAMSDMGETGSEAMDEAGEMADHAMDAAGSMMAGGDAARGKELSVDCADCHGENGMGDEDFPAIAGMDATEHAKKLADFKSGAVEGEMADYVGDLSEQDMADLAAYYATLPGK
jgi:cytochrome c553